MSIRRVPRTLVGATLLGSAAALNDGVARKPPMGWRSWNAYFGEVSQQKMQQVMEEMVSKKRLVDGTPTSLADLGYTDVGILYELALSDLLSVLNDN